MATYLQHNLKGKPPVYLLLFPETLNHRRDEVQRDGESILHVACGSNAMCLPWTLTKPAMKLQRAEGTARQ